MGKAYGYQLGVKHKYPEGQSSTRWTRVLYDLKLRPRLAKDTDEHLQLRGPALR